MSFFEDVIRRLRRVEETAAETKRLLTNAPLNLGKAKTTTIEGGQITATRPHIAVVPESGVTDDLAAIFNGSDGKAIILSPARSGDTITVIDTSQPGGGNIDLRGDNIMLAAQNQNLMLYFVEETNFWHLVGQAGNPGGGGGAADFLGLDDTPDTYTGHGGQLVAVAVSEDGLEFIAVPAGPSSSDDLPEGVTNLYFTDERAQDAVAAILAEGTGIDIDYDDGSNILTIATTITQYTDEQVRDVIGATLAEGAGIDITVDDGTDTITIATTVTQYTDEQAQDAVGTILADSATIDFTYSDGTPEITAQVKDDSITFAKMQDVATDTVLGRATASTGDIELITLTAFARSLMDDVDAAAARVTLNLDAIYGRLAASNIWTASQIIDGGNHLQFDVSGVAHGMTAVFPTTNTYLLLDAASSTVGGAYIAAASDSDATAFFALAASGSAAPTAFPFVFRAVKANGTGVQSLADTEPLAKFQNNTSDVLRLLADGTITTPHTFSSTITHSLGSLVVFTDPDVNHGMTAVSGSGDVYGILGPMSGTSGGLLLYGLNDSDNNALYFFAAVNSAAPTAAAIRFRGFKSNGTGVQSLAAGEPVFQIQNNSTNVFLAMGNGDIFMTRLGIGSPSPIDAPVHIRSVLGNTGGLKFESTTGTVLDRLHMYPSGNFSFDFWMISDGDVRWLDSVGNVVYTFKPSDASHHYSDAAVAHGMTGIVNTDTWGRITMNNGTLGGMRILGLSDDDGVGLTLIGINGGATPTVGGITVRGDKKSGTASTAFSATEVVISFMTSSTVLATILGNGDLRMISGSTLTAENIQAVDSTGLVFKDDGGNTGMVLQDATLKLMLNGLTSAGASALGIKAGSSTNDAAAGGLLYATTTTTGNVGTGEDDLASYSVPADTLSVNNQSLYFEAFGVFANNANAKTLRVRFGTSGTTLVGDASLGTGATGTWIIRGRVIRTGAATQKGVVEIHNSNAAPGQIDVATLLNQTLSGAVSLRITGEATSNNDVVLEGFRVYWEDANT